VPGALDRFNLTTDDANAIVMDARVKAGWIEPEAAEPEVPEGEAASEQASA
jgi:N utilization substance protein A